jgi:hypothetical protein
MNRFIYPSLKFNARLFNTKINKRLVNSNTSDIIKTLYPKCINCISFDKTNNTCKKFQIDSVQNYVNHNIKYEQAAIVRNDDDEDTCGETGKFFEHNYEKLSKENESILSMFIFFGALSGITNVLITEPIICFIPIFVSLLHGVIFCSKYYEIENSIKFDNERLNKLNKLLENNK